MLKINVSEWLGKKKWSQKDLAEKTGIRPATIHAYYHETIKRIEVEHLNAICKAFECQPGDLITYEEEE